MKLDKVIALAALGALIGLAVAQFFPSLGKSGLAKGLSDFAFEMGAKKPYLMDAGIGAGLGALLGLALSKK
jgi:hypothetical protein